MIESLIEELIKNSGINMSKNKYYVHKAFLSELEKVSIPNLVIDSYFFQFIPSDDEELEFRKEFIEKHGLTITDYKCKVRKKYIECLNTFFEKGLYSNYDTIIQTALPVKDLLKLKYYIKNHAIEGISANSLWNVCLLIEEPNDINVYTKNNYSSKHPYIIPCQYIKGAYVVDPIVGRIFVPNPNYKKVMHKENSNYNLEYKLRLYTNTINGENNKYKICIYYIDNMLNLENKIEIEKFVNIVNNFVVHLYIKNSILKYLREKIDKNTKEHYSYK